MRLTGTLFAAVLLAAVAGCGDDDDVLSAEEWRTQADAICEEGNERTDAILEPLFAEGEPSEEQLQEALDALIADIESQIEDVDALEPPDDLSAEVDEFLDQARTDLDELREAGIAAFDQEEDPFAETTALAAELGLEECASNE